MSGISALGVEICPSFTERMTFEPESTIRFEHRPPDGAASSWASRSRSGGSRPVEPIRSETHSTEPTNTTPSEGRHG